MNTEIRGAIINGCEIRFKFTVNYFNRSYRGSDNCYSITADAYASCLDCGHDWQEVEKNEVCYDLAQMGQSMDDAITACMEELEPKIKEHTH